MKILSFRWLLATAFLGAGLVLAAPPQSTPPPRRDHVQPQPRPQPDSTQQWEQERRRREEEARRERLRRASAARAERREALRQLREDLPKLQESALALEKKLADVDPEKELSVELREHGQEVETLAKRIHKNVKRL